MIMADVFKILFPVLGTLMSFVCLWLLFEAIYPDAVRRATEKFESRRKKSLFLGLCITAPGVLIGGKLVSGIDPVVRTLGFVIFAGLVSLALLGTTGLTRHIGERLSSPVDVTQPWRRVLRGGIVLSIAFVFPLVGWFLVLPVTLISGVGAGALSVREKKDRTVAPTAPVGVEPVSS